MLRMALNFQELLLAQHDSLDRPALVAQGQRYRRAARCRWLRMALILLILMLPGVALTYSVSVPTSQVYRLDANGEWSRFDLPMGNVLRAQIRWTMARCG